MSHSNEVDWMGLNGGVVSDISDRSLWKFNLGAAILHGAQGMMMLVASQAVTSIKEFSKQITTNFLVFDNTTKALVPQSRDVFKLEIGACAAAFLLLSAVAHAIAIFRFEAYIADINKGINRIRWYEYALSSSVMMCAIAVLFGCYDLGSLILIFLVNASMNLFGLLMEMMNPPDREETKWISFNFGCVAGAAPWVVVLLYFFGGGNFDQIPSFVYGILFGYFIFFNTFPVNMALQYGKVGRWVDYRYGEKGYILLSLFSKSLLSWLVFGGTFQPN